MIGGKYTQLLQNQPNVNNGTMWGGLAHVLQQGMLGHSMGKDQREEEATRQRLTEALTAMTGTPDNTITWNQPTRPDGTGDPTTLIPGQEPNRSLAMQIMAGDPNLAPMAFGMANSELDYQRQLDAQNNNLVQAWNPETGAYEYIRQGDALGAVAEAPPAPGEPLVREFNEGGSIVTKQWDAASQTWTPLATAPRWQPAAPAAANFSNFTNGLGDIVAVDLSTPEGRARANELAQAGYYEASITAPSGADLGVRTDGPIDPSGDPIDPDKGYHWEPDPGSQFGWKQVVTPGSEADRELQEAAETEANAAESERETADFMVQDINRAIDLVNAGWFIPLTGITGELGSFVPGTPQHDLAQIILGLEANIGFGYINEMRQASPTGGALGDVSQGELDRLTAVLGSLKQSQSRPQFLFNMERLLETYNEVIHGTNAAPTASGGGITPEDEALINKWAVQ